jgi:arylsulfate sulfotransferase
MKNLIPAILLSTICLPTDKINAASVIINGQTAGPTAFIRQAQLTANPPASIKSIKFEVTPKAGSVTRPVSATYSSEYLQKRGYYNSLTGAILLPVFGLYDNFANTVTLTYSFTDNSSQQASVVMTTPAFIDTCGYSTPTLIQARTNGTALSYDYVLLKNTCGLFSPVILDTDGRIRWVGATGFSSFVSTLFQNSIYIANGSRLFRVELDGTFALVRDYSSTGVTAFHHNIDFGKRGLILEEDTPTQIESVIIEVDTLGNILKTWQLADIITAAMTAGGDDASQFVKPAPTDWFHSNAVTYKKSDDSLLVSSRENFVIALNYADGAIKWILGETTKLWYQFQSLRNFALALNANTLPPIGEHALSITKDDNLLLFDNGQNSLNQTPPGLSRTYSAPRKYQINIQSKVATELWNYPNNQALFSPFCSSVYEDSALNYLVTYSFINNVAPPLLLAEILGLDAAGNKVFDYRYPTTNCNTAWNATPVHLEEMSFTTLVPTSAVSRKTHGTVGTFDIPLPLAGTPGIECRSGGASHDYQIVVTFANPVTITGGVVAPGLGGTATLVGVPGVVGNQVTVNLTNVSNVQTLTLNLIGVTDGLNTENISVPISVLTADTTANGSVNLSDINQVKSRSGQAVNTSNFRQDVTANGSINSSDVALTQAKSGTALPPTPAPVGTRLSRHKPGTRSSPQLFFFSRTSGIFSRSGARLRMWADRTSGCDLF